MNNNTPKVVSTVEQFRTVDDVIKWMMARANKEGLGAEVWDSYEFYEDWDTDLDLDPGPVTVQQAYEWACSALYDWDC